MVKAVLNLHHLSGTKKSSPQKSNWHLRLLLLWMAYAAEEIVDILDSDEQTVPHNDQLQGITPFSDHQSYPTP